MFSTISSCVLIYKKCFSEEMVGVVFTAFVPCEDISVTVVPYFIMAFSKK
jgi:hypothetical protein